MLRGVRAQTSGNDVFDSPGLSQLGSQFRFGASDRLSEPRRRLRHQQQPCRDGPSTHSSPHARPVGREPFGGDSHRDQRHNAQIHDSNNEEDRRETRAAENAMSARVSFASVAAGLDAPGESR